MSTSSSLGLQVYFIPASHSFKEGAMLNFALSFDLEQPFKAVCLTEEESYQLVEILDRLAPHKDRFIGHGREGKKGWYVKYKPHHH